ncbi:MAG TPA: hypothetical protein VFT75_04665 [Nocardioidaceae bacterium]|jgi:hypothetical protein|nr:hypothetical protein [Nocardioidaceae bacterium]
MGPLSPADAQKVARAVRRAHRRQVAGVGRTVHGAALDLAEPSGESTMTLQQLLNHAAVAG